METTTQNTTELEYIIEALKLDSADSKELTPEQLEERRKQLNVIGKLVSQKMSETSTKDHNYDINAISEYIQDILEQGFKGIPTELSDYPEFVDAQHLKRFKDLIEHYVELSDFGSKNFKIHSLRLLRSNIAKAKTLHELRQAVLLMISPLELYREHIALLEKYSPANIVLAQKEETKYIESLCLEIEELQSLCDERKRVIDSLLECYEEDDSDIALLRNIESAKRQHKLSDTDAAKMFGVSRKKLLTLRENIKLNAKEDNTNEANSD